MKRYKKYQLLFTINIIIIILFILFVISLTKINYNEYTKLNSIYIIDNVVESVVTSKQLKYLEKNNFVYLNSSRKKIEILSITKNIYKRDGEFYHQILLKINKIKENTIINMSIPQKKRKLIILIKDCWKE